MSPITTHILDIGLGTPAAGVTVKLYQIDAQGNRQPVRQGTTNDDGRVADLLPAGTAINGLFSLVFEIEEFFTRSERESFYPFVEVTFRVNEERGHYHVPLLLSPFGYSTYRGS